MAKIKVKGIKEPFEITTYQASEIEKDWANESIPRSTPVKLGMFTGKLGDIVAIDKRGEFQSGDKEEFYQQQHREYLEIRRQQISLSPIDRAKSLALFELVFRSLHGTSEIPESSRIQAIAIQEKFFTENPKRVYCEPNLFRPAIPENPQHRMINAWESGALGIIEKVVLEDKRYAKYGN